jgi:hypothetical protein
MYGATAEELGICIDRREVMAEVVRKKLCDLGEGCRGYRICPRRRQCALLRFWRLLYFRDGKAVMLVDAGFRP